MQNILANEKLLKHIEWANLALLIGATLGALSFFSFKIALGVLLGGLVASASFQVLKWQLKKAFQTPGKVPKKGGLFITYYLRFLATLFVVFTVIYYEWANPIAFLVGLSVVVMSIVVVGVGELLLMIARKGSK